MEPIVYLILGALLVGAIAYYSWKREQQRAAALQRFAAELGWRYDPTVDRSFHSRYPHSVFKRGDSRRAYHLVTGTVDVAKHAFPLTLGDYRFSTGSGKNRHTYRFSFLLLTPPWDPVCPLHIRRENIGDRVLGALGFDDIDFESEEFSRKFHVASDNKRFAYAVIHPRMIEFLLQTTPPHIELVGGVCLLYVNTSRQWSIDEFRKHLAWARQFFELWPTNLLTELHLLGRPEAAKG